jgi:DNA-binding MarR family transcriptional regulator
MQSGRADRDGFLALEALRKLVRLLRDSAQTVERRTGVTGAQLFVLRVLAEHPGLSINELARRTMTHQSSVSVVVSRLVARGLCARVPAAEDRRRLIVSLTPRGRLVHRGAPAAAQELIIEAVRGLAPRHRRGLADGLRALTDALGASGGRASMFFEDEERSRAARPRPEDSRHGRKRRTSALHA